MAETKKAEGLKIRIRLKAYDHRVIDQSAKQIVDTAIRTGATVSGPVPLPTKRSTFTVVKSPHVYKTGGEAFEMKVHKRLIDISNATPKTIDSLQNLALPAGVDAEIKMQIIDKKQVVKAYFLCFLRPLFPNNIILHNPNS